MFQLKVAINHYLRKMEALLQQIEGYKLEIAAADATNAEMAEAFRIKWLGTKGLVKAIMGERIGSSRTELTILGQRSPWKT